MDSFSEFVEQFGDTVPGNAGGDIYRHGNLPVSNVWNIRRKGIPSWKRSSLNLHEALRATN
jgi:hypothetical protein